MNEQTPEPDLPQSKMLALIGAQAAVFTVLGAALWMLSGRNLSEFIRFDSDGLLLGLALAAGMTAIGAIGFMGFQRISDRIVEMQAHHLTFLRNRLSWGGIIAISFCAGIWEEALFRGGLQTLLTDWLGPVAAIIIAAALFAVVHMAKPLIGGMIFIIGVVFGAVYFYSGSLFAVMLGHALYDIFALWYVQKRLHELNFFAEAEPN